MTIRFVPAGLPISTSFSKNALFAETATSLPATASNVGYALFNYGPTGSAFLTVQSVGLG